TATEQPSAASRCCSHAVASSTPTGTATCSCASSYRSARSRATSPTAPTCTPRCRRRTTSGTADTAPPSRSRDGPRSGVPAMHRRRQVRQHVERGVHECEMRERLREVPEQPLRPGVVLLGQEPEIVCKTDQPLEERVRIVVAAAQL